MPAQRFHINWEKKFGESRNEWRLLSIGMRVKCVSRRLEINKRQTRRGECIQRVVSHTHHQRHKWNFRFRLLTRREMKDGWGVGGCGMWDGDGEVMGTLGRSGASRIVSNTMLAQHSARLIAIALTCLQTHSYLAVCPARNCIWIFHNLQIFLCSPRLEYRYGYFPLDTTYSWSVAVGVRVCGLICCKCSLFFN